MASEKDIAACRCPLCGSGKAHLRLSSKGLAYVICNGCNMQLFARSDVSDRLVRDLHQAAPSPASSSSPAPGPAAPAPRAPEAAGPAPARGLGWGILR